MSWPQTLNPKPSTLNPQTSTPNPKPQTRLDPIECAKESAAAAESEAFGVCGLAVSGAVLVFVFALVSFLWGGGGGGGGVQG